MDDLNTQEKRIILKSNSLSKEIWITKINIQNFTKI